MFHFYLSFIARAYLWFGCSTARLQPDARAADVLHPALGTAFSNESPVPPSCGTVLPSKFVSGRGRTRPRVTSVLPVRLVLQKALPMEKVFIVRRRRLRFVLVPR